MFQWVKHLWTHYRSNKNWWMIARVFKEYLHNWNPTLRKEKIDLMLDNCTNLPYTKLSNVVRQNNFPRSVFGSTDCKLGKPCVAQKRGSWQEPASNIQSGKTMSSILFIIIFYNYIDYICIHQYKCTFWCLKPYSLCSIF